MIKVSIITPSYNQGNYIENTIKSILSQKGDFELEYIIIDGKSTDNTLEIIKQHAAQDTRLQWISEADNGQSDAINKGLNMATGDIIAWLNSDDLYEEGALQKIADYFKANPDINWLFGKCKIINENGNEIRKYITAYKNYFLKKYSYKKLLAENFVSQPTVFWRKSFQDKIGLLNLDENYCMDYEYWLRMGKTSKPSYLDTYLSSFRYYSESKSGAVNKKQFQDELRLAKKFGKKYPLAIKLHQFNYYKITFIYKILDAIT